MRCSDDLSHRRFGCAGPRPGLGRRRRLDSGLEDAAAFYAADSAGFFIAEEGGTPVAAISVVNHNADFAFLGLYHVVPADRGRGIGYRLWRHALDHAGERVVGLDGVPDQQANYVASEFSHAGPQRASPAWWSPAKRLGSTSAAQVTETH